MCFKKNHKKSDQEAEDIVLPYKHFHHFHMFTYKLRQKRANKKAAKEEEREELRLYKASLRAGGL